MFKLGDKKGFSVSVLRNTFWTAFPALKVIIILSFYESEQSSSSNY